MSDKTIHIRTAGVDDLDDVVRFNQAMALETEGKKLDPQEANAGARNGLGDPRRSLYFVAEIDGRVVGQTMVTLEWSDWRNGFFWWVQSVYVEPEHRRRGVFRKLYEYIRAQAKERAGVCGIRLYVHNENTRALDTYRKLGMTVTDYLLCEEAWSPARSSTG